MKPTPKAPLESSKRVQIIPHGSDELAGDDELHIYVFEDVLDELLLQAVYRPEPCVTLLLGGFHKSPTGQLWVEIGGFDRATYVEDYKHALELFGSHYPRLRQDLADNDHKQVVLGWSLGMPDGGAKLEPDAAFIQLTFFNLAHQLCLIMDPITEQLGFYRRGKDGHFKNVAFKLIRIAPSKDADVQEDEPKMWAKALAKTKPAPAAPPQPAQDAGEDVQQDDPGDVAEAPQQGAAEEVVSAKEAVVTPSPTQDLAEHTQTALATESSEPHGGDDDHDRHH